MPHESMRLTTRLMQIASWLLVQRAVREGDMEAADACEERYRLSPVASSESEPDKMPEGLITLLERANRLYERISHMDKRMFIDAESEAPAVNQVLTQMQRLQNAFGAAPAAQ